MIEQGLFKRHFVGRDGFIWWLGQIAPAKSWEPNNLGYGSRNTADLPGFAERYKVRIMGYHTADPEELPDDALPWAQVMYPVTSGGGNGGSDTTFIVQTYIGDEKIEEVIQNVNTRIQQQGKTFRLER